MTPREKIDIGEAIMGGIHEPCGMPHKLGEGCTKAFIEHLINVAMQEAIAEQREADAKIAEASGYYDVGEDIAAMIREGMHP